MTVQSLEVVVESRKYRGCLSFKILLIVIKLVNCVYEIPGDHFAVFGCRSCRNTKGIEIWKLWKLSASRNDDYKQWLNELSKTQEVDKDFQRLIDNDRVYTCEKHFAPDDIELRK